MKAWLTPDTPLPSLVAYRVYLPDNDALRAAFYGAFLLLTVARNWEQFGTATPDQIAELFSEAWLLTVPEDGNLEECP